MRVLLTGVSGYLGGVLARHLAGAPDVEGITGVDTAPPASVLPGRVRFVQMDIRSPDLAEALAGHAVLVHTAFVVLWSARMPRAVRDDINLNGARNVAQAAVAAGVERVLHASSVLAYDPARARGRERITEAEPIGRDGMSGYYAHGKAAAERALGEGLAAGGVPLTVFRPSYILGPGNTATVNGFRQSPVRFVGCDPRLQFVHEDDVATAFLQAVRHPMPGAYNVVPDDWLRWSEVLGTLGLRSVPAIPVWLARVLAAARWRWLGSPIHPSWLDAMLLDFTASNGKLRATGWRPRSRSKAALRAAR
jgi:UDP-glucose 4-epimerase